MSLLDRVATLIRANLNDLIDKAEDPEKLCKQLLLDMQNQFMQLKTQTAIAIAHQHLLRSQQQEQQRGHSEWMGKAEVALTHGEEALARAALAQALAQETAAAQLGQQVEQQAEQIVTLRASLQRLEAKMGEIRAQTDLLLARHRRARVATHTSAAGFQNQNEHEAFERLRKKVLESEAIGQGYAEVNKPGVAATLETLEKNDRVEGLLAELKRKRELT